MLYGTGAIATAQLNSALYGTHTARSIVHMQHALGTVTIATIQQWSTLDDAHTARSIAHIQRALWRSRSPKYHRITLCKTNIQHTLRHGGHPDSKTVLRALRCSRHLCSAAVQHSQPHIERALVCIALACIYSALYGTVARHNTTV